MYARFFSKAAEEQAEAAFEFLDQDGSGTIGIKEFLSLCDIFFLEFDNQGDEDGDGIPDDIQDPLLPRVQRMMATDLYGYFLFLLLVVDVIIITVPILEGRSLTDPLWPSAVDHVILGLLVLDVLLDLISNGSFRRFWISHVWNRSPPWGSFVWPLFFDSSRSSVWSL